MIRKILILCFLLSSFILAQQYSNDKYEKYVGTKLGKYPLTVTGLKKAITSLDSGVVYISYPGLWDTTGLGQIPNKIALHGYLFGNIVTSLASNPANLFYKYLWSDGTGTYASTRSADEIGDYSFSPFVFTSRLESWWPVVGIYNVLDRNQRLIKQANSRMLSFDVKSVVDTSYHGGLATIPTIQSLQSHLVFNSDSSSSTKNFGMISNISGTIDYRQKYQTQTMWGLWGMNSSLVFHSGSDTITTYDGGEIVNHRSEFAVESDVFFNSNIYGFYSKMPAAIASRLIGTKKAYHFYGDNNYPSYFGGDLKADGTSIKFENMPSDSTGLSTGQLYYDTNGFVKRKF